MIIIWLSISFNGKAGTITAFIKTIINLIRSAKHNTWEPESNLENVKDEL